MSLPLGLLIASELVARPVPDFELRDTRGATVRLSSPAASRATVVVFLGVDCPLANKYPPRHKELARKFPAGTVWFLAVNSNDHDDVPAMAGFARDHDLTFPYLKDPDGRVADLFGATRTPRRSCWIPI